MKKLTLILTNPCAESWEDMSQAGTGRFCEQCEKNIVDLTTKSDAELIQFFKTKKDNVCGRLLDSQLNRELVLPSQKANWQWLLPLAIGAIAVTPAAAKDLRPVMIQNDQASALPTVPVEYVVEPPRAIDTISGKVVDEQTGEPLKGVKIKLKGFENVLALTDSTGEFKLNLTAEKMASAFIFELNGYSDVEVQPSNGMVIKLIKGTTVRLGGISSFSRLSQSPLYVIYVGKKSCVIDTSRLDEISLDWVENVELLQGAKATSLYGAKAVNGVVLLGIKEVYANKFDFSKKKK